jgi:hypothetical protein
MPDETHGILLDVSGGERHFLAYTLEDEFRTNKVFGETRIPAGTYEIKFRTEGGHHKRYGDKFPSIHKGMLWLQDVPNFKWILIHIGNDDDDTAGCLLVGDDPEPLKNQLQVSTRAYKRVYSHVSEVLSRGEKVEIEYIDYDSV